MKCERYSASRLLCLIPIKYALLLLMLGTTWGCAVKSQIRVDDQLFENNTTQKIAILSSSKISYPLLRSKGNGLNINDSKESVSIFLSQAKQVFTTKGYEVLYAEPIGIGYNCKDWWLMDESGASTKNSPPPMTTDTPAPTQDAPGSPENVPSKAGNENTSEMKKISDSAPVYTYAAIASNRELNAAVSSLLGDLEDAISTKKISSFQPKPLDIKVIQDITQVDTICINRIFGQKYTAARKAGDFALNTAAAMFGVYAPSHTTEMTESFFTCIDAGKSSVLWQHSVYMAGDPVSPSDSFQNNVLKYFPEKGKPLDRDRCKKNQNGSAVCSD